MSYTENLELKIIDGTDAFRESFSQGNYNANVLEEKIGGFLDDLENLPSMNNAIIQNTNDIAETNSQVELVRTEVANNANDIRILEETKYKEVINNDGVEKEGTRYRVKLLCQPVGWSGTSYCKEFGEEETTKRIAFARGGANLDINITELFNITNISKFELLSFITYEKEYLYGAEQNNIGFKVKCIGQKPNNTDYYIMADNNRITVYNQTLNNNVWTPSARPLFDPNREVVVNIEYFIED